MNDTSGKHRVVLALTASYRALGCVRRKGLLAVSGGADSLALLLGTAAVSPDLGLSLEVASFDHGLRAEAGDEIEVLRTLCERLQVPFHARALNLSTGAGLEERGRVQRYRALEEIRAARRLDFIATAHTANDQAETLLMRLARGSALRGASGILARRGAVIRPLLQVKRSEVEDFLATQGVAAAKDAMNKDRAYFRTRIRLDVLPALESASGTCAIDKLAAFAEGAAEDEELLREMAMLARERLSVGDAGLDAVGLRALPRPIQLRVLLALLESNGLAADRFVLSEGLRTLHSGGKVTLPRGFILESAGDLVRCVAPDRVRPAYSVLLDESGNWHSIVEAGLRLRIVSRPQGSLRTSLPDDVQFPLTVRTRLAGDRLIEPAGFSRKLQDWLVDQRIPSEFRDSLPIVVDSRNRIVWLPGLWPSSPESVREGRWLQAEPLEGSGVISRLWP